MIETKGPNPKCECGEYLKSKCTEPNVNYEDTCNLLVKVRNGTANWKWMCLKCGREYKEESK